jgi:hypothetical protein
MADSIGRYQVQCQDCGYYAYAKETEEEALACWNTKKKRSNHVHLRDEDKIRELYAYVCDELECHKRGQENARVASRGYEMDYQRGMRDMCNRIKTMMGLSFSFLFGDDE